MKYTIITKELEYGLSANDRLTGETSRVLQAINIEGLTYEQALGCLEVLKDNYSRGIYTCDTRGEGRMKERGYVYFYWWKAIRSR